MGLTHSYKFNCLCLTSQSQEGWTEGQVGRSTQHWSRSMRALPAKYMQTDPGMQRCSHTRYNRRTNVIYLEIDLLFSSGPGFFVCFLAVSTPEVSWDQLSWAQVYRFRFFCFCVSWAHREQAHEMTGDLEQTGKVSHVPWARLSCVIMAPT